MNILKRPMFFAAVSCCVAAAISLYIKELAFVIIAVSVLFIFIPIFAKKYQYITVAFVMVIFALSIYLEFSKIDKLDKYDGQIITGGFLVIDETVDHGDFNSVILKELDCNKVPNGIKLFVYDYEKRDFNIGDIIDVKFKLGIIDKYNRYRLSNYGESVYAYANLLEVKETNDYDFFYKSAGRIRHYVKDTISLHFKGDTAGLLLALTTGDKTLLSDEFSCNIKTTGISHVVVVSGMHLAIIMMAVFWCLDRLFYNKYIRCAISILLVIIIFGVCGFTMSITRAGVMFLIAGFAAVFGRSNDSLSSLLTAITMVLIGAPFAIFNVSFQLSVLSTLAIIWIVPFYSNLFKTIFKIKSNILKFFIDTFLCSMAAIVFTLPVTIKIFGYISVVSPITNMIIAYPVMLALILNIFALVISTIPIINFLSFVAFFLAGVCSRFMVDTVNLIAKLPITVAVLPKSAFWCSIVIIGLVVGYMYLYEYKKKRSEFDANSI